MGKPVQPLQAFVTFGDLLKYLRRKARLTQTELSIAVGYSVSHISRLESNQRTIDRASLFSLFIPVLHLEHEAETTQRLVELAEEMQKTRRAEPPALAVHLPSLYTTSLSKVSNFPIERTSFIGREKVINQICQILFPLGLLGEATSAPVRLLTLTGAGGSGKTRLALRVGSLLAASYPDGARLVELAPLADPERVPQAVVSALGLFTEADRSPLVDLIKFLSAWRGLIILDNCEHLVYAAAGLVEALLGSCPDVQILATSREPLRVPGEATFRVPSLSVPPDDLSTGDPVTVTKEYEATRLFVERARTAIPDFQVTEPDLVPLAQICRQLDGIPLAIELAAARVNVLSISQIAGRLEKDFRLLASPHRAPVLRHQTLQATIDWSYSLLSEAEQRLFRRLSIFSGGCSLAAVEQVCIIQQEAGISAASGLIDLLAALIDKSLIASHPVHGAEEIGLRYEYQEVVRQYALEKLDQSGEINTIREKHLSYFLTYAEEGWKGHHSSTRLEWYHRLGADLNNLLAAVDWAYASPGRAEAGVRIAVALKSFFWSRGLHHEQLALLRKGLGFPLSDLLRARVLVTIGEISSDDTIRRQNYGEGEKISRALGDAALPELAVALSGIYSMRVELGDSTELVLARLNESVSILRSLDPDYLGLLSHFLFIRSYFLTHGAKTQAEQAYQDAEESIVIGSKIGDRWQTVEGLYGLGCIHALGGELEKAGHDFAQALALSKEEEDVVGIAIGSFYVSWAAFLQGNYDRALHYNRDSLEFTHKRIRKPVFAGGNVAAASTYLTFHSLQLVGEERASRLRRAAVLRRAAACLYPKDSTYITVALEGVFDRAEEVLRRELTEEELSAAYEAGQTLTQEQVYSLVMDLDFDDSINANPTASSSVIP